MSKAVYNTLLVVIIFTMVVVILGVYLVTGQLLAFGYAGLLSFFLIYVLMGYYYYRKSHCTFEVAAEVVSAETETDTMNNFVKVRYVYKGSSFEKVLVATKKQSKLMGVGSLLKTGDKIPVMINPNNPKDVIFASRNLVPGV